MFSPRVKNYTAKADLDELFKADLAEIRATYVDLPTQALKIRVEKWCVKLVSTGSTSGNRIFSKHRNDYAKLLLHMVKRKRLEAPYHTSPPDGPLPTFPAHLRMHIRGDVEKSSQERENLFWNELNEDFNEGKEDRREGDTSMLFGSSKDSKSAQEKFQENEIDRLQGILRENDNRISSLRQQIREERLKHEIELQRLQHEHRIEISKLETIARKNLLSSSPSSSSSSSSSIRPSLVVEENVNGSSYGGTKSSVPFTSTNHLMEDDEDLGDVASLVIDSGKMSKRPQNSSGTNAPTSVSSMFNSSSYVAEENGNTKSNRYYDGIEKDEEFLEYIDKFQEEIRKSVEK